MLLDPRLYTPRYPRVAGSQVEAVPYRRPGINHPVLAAPAAEPADPPRSL